MSNKLSSMIRAAVVFGSLSAGAQLVACLGVPVQPGEEGATATTSEALCATPPCSTGSGATGGAGAGTFGTPLYCNLSLPSGLGSATITANTVPALSACTAYSWKSSVGGVIYNFWSCPGTTAIPATIPTSGAGGVTMSGTLNGYHFTQCVAGTCTWSYYFYEQDARCVPDVPVASGRVLIGEVTTNSTCCSGGPNIGTGCGSTCGISFNPTPQPVVKSPPVGSQ